LNCITSFREGYAKMMLNYEENIKRIIDMAILQNLKKEMRNIYKTIKLLYKIRE
jgi:hypothetical protein